MKVFVYGTLKRGHGNYRVMEAANGEFVSEATLSGARMYNLGYYPGVKFAPAEESVSGELFEVPTDGVLTSLDRLEGHPKFYTRSEALVRDTDGAEHTAWVYFFPHPVSEAAAMPEGVWRGAAAVRTA